MAFAWSVFAASLPAHSDWARSDSLKCPPKGAFKFLTVRQLAWHQTPFGFLNWLPSA